MQTSSAAPNVDLIRAAELGNELLVQLNAVRETAPVVWNESVNGWIVARHADVQLAFSGKLPLSNHRFGRTLSAIPENERARRIPLMLETLPHWIVNSDPPEHTRLRKLLVRAFGRKVVEDMRPFARETIGRVLDQAAARREVEFVNDIARAITGRVILRVLGLSEDHLVRMPEWSANLNNGLGSAQPPMETLEATERSLREMKALFDDEIARRRRNPTEDFLSQMLLAREGADQLSEEEILGVCYVVLIAGHDTTMNTMVLDTVALANDAAARRYLLEHPEEIGNCIMELGRYTAMSTTMPRIVAESFEWHGQQLRKGDVVFLMIAGANRDPRTFANPESIDMRRPTDQVMAFGSGLHHCIGHLLAKMQLSEFFPELLRRFDPIEILDARLDFSPSISQRGLESLHVRMNPR
ncbi:MAG: cytochrome P450 [Steroidobacteraceae bacterium]